MSLHECLGSGVTVRDASGRLLAELEQPACPGALLTAKPKVGGALRQR